MLCFKIITRPGTAQLDCWNRTVFAQGNLFGPCLPPTPPCTIVEQTRLLKSASREAVTAVVSSAYHTSAHLQLDAVLTPPLVLVPLVRDGIVGVFQDLQAVAAAQNTRETGWGGGGVREKSVRERQQPNTYPQLTTAPRAQAKTLIYNMR